MTVEVEVKPIIIRGDFRDLSDILKIARAEGKKAFKVDRVRVHPRITYGISYCIVIIEPEGNGGEKRAWRKSANIKS